ncbi:hypothetical protein SAMN04489761_4600 [Tenacibaculum sp. MAR_2009_124]|uniref:hypothetical protein n=1 Tax=Tenacibaculum sp. MAR_2009_124 TaxID=1250059 RepID=UPI00089A4F8B|nr:hypothetical protein [Tenacibaculum sp. MAR_2009_124]SED20104.1 hypothetical protein SAMN04489761_4600 [Tenacibaculum sp. MAR_2009_124]
MNFLKKNKWIILILILLIGGLVASIKYLYRAPKQIEEIEAAYKGTSINFITLLQEDSLKWNNVSIEISGTVTELVGNNFVMDNFIFCQLKENSEPFLSNQLNTSITIKGIVIGYDELLNELKINQCIILN